MAGAQFAAISAALTASGAAQTANPAANPSPNPPMGTPSSSSSTSTAPPATSTAPTATSPAATGAANKTNGRTTLPTATSSGATSGSAIEFELNGLRYQTLTRAGVTVMFAQTSSVIRNYNVIQVTVANGSKKPVEIKPGDFAFIDATTGNRSVPASPSGIVKEFMDRGERNDVVKLVEAYEQTLYGMTRTAPTSGYERRRQSMVAEFQDPRLRAGATASAIVFVSSKLQPGESTDGALFFKTTQNRILGGGKLLVSTPMASFEFDTYVNPLDPNTPK
jgi:hypothetical protein